MKTFKYLLSLLVLIIGMTSCEFPENVNPKRASEVPPSTLFTNAEIALVNQINSMSVNSNISRLLVQYWQEATYFTEARYNFADRQIPDAYARNLYRNSIRDFIEARDLLNAQELTGTLATKRDNQVAIAGILEVYAYQVAVDAFGNFPYSEAFLGIEDSSPIYDDAATIYADLFTRIAADIAKLNASQGSYGAADVIYGGDVTSWKRFAASLQLRLGMRLADINASAASAAVTAAIANGVFTSQDQSGILYYSGVNPHINTIYNGFTVSGRKDFMATNTIVDIMLALDDPRLPLYFTQKDGEYVGAVAGLDAAQTYANFSHFTDRFMAADFEAILIDYVEVEFLLAEAAQRGMTSGVAEDHYDAGVTASILWWDGSSADAATYVAANAYDAANWKESIGTQKWLALYNRGVEAWAEWRRLDFPILNVPTDMVYGDIPSRMPYPYNEVTDNKENYTAAAAAIGGDDHRTKLFWDVN